MTAHLTHTSGTAVRCDAGIAAALDSAAALGCSATQIMFRDPMSYVRKTPLPPEDETALWNYREMRIAAHASNFCVLTKDPSDNKQKLANRTILQDLRLAKRHGVMGTVVHSGTWRNAQHEANALENVTSIMEQAPAGPTIFLENSASNKSVHANLEPLFRIATKAGAMICLDTGHAIAAGIPLWDPVTISLMIEPFAERIGLVHFNNPRHPLGSSRDGHDLLSNGYYGLQIMEEVHNLLRPLMPEAPFIIESTDQRHEVDLLHHWGALSLGQPSPLLPAPEV